MSKPNIYFIFLLLLISIVSICCIDTYIVYETFEQNLDIQIVVARYNENLNWLKDEPFRSHPAIIYNKGDNTDFYSPPNNSKHIQLPNVGREGHTYLFHIIQNYDHLPEITVFLPGSANTKNKYNPALEMFSKIQETGNTHFVYDTDTDVYTQFKDFQIEKYSATHSANASKNPNQQLEKCEFRPFGVWFQKRFGNIQVKKMSYGGIMAIHKKHILQHPKSHYEELIKELEVAENTEVGHYFERAWAAVFHPIDW